MRFKKLYSTKYGKVGTIGELLRGMVILILRVFRKRASIIIVLSVVLVGILATSCLASLFTRAGYDATTYPGYARGVYGWMNTLYHPPIANKHLTSFFIWQHPDGYNFVELGQKRHAGWSSAQYFWAIKINGVYWGGTGPGSPDGTDHYYHLYRDHYVGGGVYQWYFLVDSQHLFTLNAQIYTGVAFGSSERNALGDTNWGHFWNCYKMSNSGSWSKWSYGLEYNPGWRPDYYYHYYKVSNSEFYVLPN